MLQSGGQVIDVGGGNRDRCGVEKRRAAAANSIAAHLNQQGLHDVGIKFLGRQPYQITQGAAHRERGAIGSHTSHGIERIRDAYDAH